MTNAPRSHNSFLVAANLTFGDGFDPAEPEVDGDGDDADDPEYLAVVLAVVSEDDGEDDSAQVSTGAGDAGYDS